LQRCASELDLNAAEGASAKQSQQDAETANEATRQTDRSSPRTIPPLVLTNSVVDLIASRADLVGLPVRGAKECRASDDAVKPLQDLSQQVRRAQARADRESRFSDDPKAPEDLNGRARISCKAATGGIGV
jgi:hypothetical protein